LQPGQRVINSEILVVTGDKLDEPARQFLENDEVLDDVQQALLGARPPKHGFQRNAALFAFGIDLLPFQEVFPGRGDAAHLGLGTIRQNNERVRREQVWDRVAIVAEVVIVGVMQILVTGLELDEDQRNAIDESQEIGASFIQVALDPQLRNEKKLVVVRVLPVNDREPLGDLAAVGLTHRDGHAIAQQFVHLTVRTRVMQGAPVPRDLDQRLVDAFSGDGRVEAPKRTAE
jgi:hypothetical protein